MNCAQKFSSKSFRRIAPVLWVGAWECVLVTLIWCLESFSCPKLHKIVDRRLPKSYRRQKERSLDCPLPGWDFLLHPQGFCLLGLRPCGVWLPWDLSPVTKNCLGCQIPQKSGHSGVTAKDWPPASPQQECMAGLSWSFSQDIGLT